MLKAYRSLHDIECAFSDEDDCYWYLGTILWPQGVRSVFTGTNKVTKVNDRTYLCKETGKRFKVTNGTIFANSKVSLPQWFKIIWLHEVEPGLSSVEVAKRLGMNQKTVWRVLQKLDEVKDLEHLQAI